MPKLRVGRSIDHGGAGRSCPRWMDGPQTSSSTGPVNGHDTETTPLLIKEIAMNKSLIAALAISSAIAVVGTSFTQPVSAESTTNVANSANLPTESTDTCRPGWAGQDCYHNWCKPRDVFWNEYASVQFFRDRYLRFEWSEGIQRNHYTDYQRQTGTAWYSVGTEVRNSC
jgi:hypothetical protein